MECDNKCEWIYLEDKDPDKSKKITYDMLNKAPNKRVHTGADEWGSVYEIPVPATTGLITIYAENKEYADKSKPHTNTDKDLSNVQSSRSEANQDEDHIVQMTDSNPGGIKYELFNTEEGKIASCISLSNSNKNPVGQGENVIDLPGHLKLWYGAWGGSTYGLKQKWADKMGEYWKMGYDSSSWLQNLSKSLSISDITKSKCTDGGWSVVQKQMVGDSSGFWHKDGEIKDMAEWLTNVKGTNEERLARFDSGKTSRMQDRFHTAYIARICLRRDGDKFYC